jgi:hypothetical protein
MTGNPLADQYLPRMITKGMSLHLSVGVKRAGAPYEKTARL